MSATVVFAAFAAATSARSAASSASSAARCVSLASRCCSASSRALTLSAKRAQLPAVALRWRPRLASCAAALAARRPDRAWLRPARVGPGQPIGEMEQLAQRGDRLVGRHGPRLVHRHVAEVLDDPRLGDERAPDERSERRFMDACRERGLVRVSQAAVALVEPPDRDLERKPGVEARGTRIGKRQALRLRTRDGGCVEIGERWL